jgi:hypothetical protein
MRGKTEIRWQTNPHLFEEIMESYNNLINNGWIEPPVRTLLYQLMGDYPEKWKKKHYGKLTSYLQRKKDEGTLEYGLFSSDSGGNHYLVPTRKKINEQIEIWQKTKEACLQKDNCLWLIFHEHEGMIPTLAKLFNYKVGTFSSQGQIRHEHLHKVMSEAEETLDYLDGEEIKIIGIADYDIYGAKNIESGQGHIIRNHANWIEDNFPAEFILYGITKEQIEEVDLDPNDEHQFDGWLQRYSLQSFERDIRRMIGL